MSSSPSLVATGCVPSSQQGRVLRPHGGRIAMPAEVEAVSNGAAASPTAAPAADMPAVAQKPSTIEHEVLKPGNGITRPVTGSLVTAHYVGTLKSSGKTFDSSRTSGKKPIRFRIGEDQVIKGCEMGVLKMTLGERALLTIPAHLAYGEAGGGGGIVPPNADLVFDVELLEIEGRTRESMARYEQEVNKWVDSKLASFDADDKFRAKRLEEHGSREAYEIFLKVKGRKKLATVPTKQAAEDSAA
mmetsp:Transcript_11950/g.31227  ORF Transcript_11950/g.31227 Transcript_11950/m.31227 type:complete len:244 (-) Transcript_11950:3375-4106(-)